MLLFTQNAELWDWKQLYFREDIAVMSKKLYFSPLNSEVIPKPGFFSQGGL